MPESEDLEKKKREAWWKKILAYYMMEQYAHQQEKADEILHSSSMLNLLTARMVKDQNLISRLLEREEGEESAFVLLAEMEADGDEDIPFQWLLEEIRKPNPSEEKLNRELSKVVISAPAMVIEHARKERERKLQRRNSYGDAADGFVVIDNEDIRYEKRLRRQTVLLRKVLPPKVFQQLREGLRREGYAIDERGGNVRMPDFDRQAVSYRQYVEQKRVDPREKDGKLANSGDVYTAAAYMIAAYEQKDAQQFDEQKADARAMELSGSRAFRVYMNGHPGSLVAAARNTGVESTHDDIAALDADLKRRDAVLSGARDSLKSMATGKTACFHKMLGALERFVNADEEPSEQERTGLVNALAEYVFTDCMPKSREANAACFTQSMCALKALLPEQDFAQVVEEANRGRDPKVEVEDFNMERTRLDRAGAERDLERTLSLELSE